MVAIKIWSDLMCPFCFIGKNHLTKAIDELGLGDQVEIEWKSFQLDPTIPEDIDATNLDYLSQSKGWSIEQTKEMLQHVTDMGKNAGVDFHFENQKVTNSLKAHRILKTAQDKGLGNDAQSILFKAYFTDGVDFNKEEELVNLGLKIGLNAEEIQNAIQDQELNNRIQQDILEAQQAGVRGVPFFVFNDKYAMSGAQPTESFKECLSQLIEEKKLTTFGDESGSSCSTEGCD